MDKNHKSSANRAIKSSQFSGYEFDAPRTEVISPGVDREVVKTKVFSGDHNYARAYHQPNSDQVTYVINVGYSSKEDFIRRINARLRGDVYHRNTVSSKWKR